MNFDEYFILFHKLELNRVAFKRLIDCHEEVLKLVNAAIDSEREACAKIAETAEPYQSADLIRKRGQA
jgi:uncharacterized protein YdcH (DUF465 family)